MKNKILNLIMLVLVFAGLSGCEDETTGGKTGITYYPTLEILGDPMVIVDKGTEYVDAGCHSELRGVDVTDQVEISSDVDVTTAGVYSVHYSITNEDGFIVSGSRTVYVADPTPSVISTGVHTVAEGTHRVNENTGAVTEYDGYSIIILQTEPGIFYISDFLAGYYDQHVGYGSNYAMTGSFQLNPDNTITPLDSYVVGFGDSMDEISVSTVDPSTGAITYTLSYAGFLTFNVIIN